MVVIDRPFQITKHLLEINRPSKTSTHHLDLMVQHKQILQV